MCCLCVYHILFEHLRCNLECCHIIYFGPGIILVCDFYCPFNVTIFLVFFLWDHMGQWFCCTHCYFPIIMFDNFSLFCVTVKCWLLVGRKIIVFFAWFTGWSSSGNPSTIVTLGGSALVIGFDCGDLFIWVLSWFISWSFFWPTSLTGTLGGTAGVFFFSEYIG